MCFKEAEKGFPCASSPLAAGILHERSELGKRVDSAFKFNLGGSDEFRVFGLELVKPDQIIHDLRPECFQLQFREGENLFSEHFFELCAEWRMDHLGAERHRQLFKGGGDLVKKTYFFFVEFISCVDRVPHAGE